MHLSPYSHTHIQIAVKPEQSLRWAWKREEELGKRVMKNKRREEEQNMAQQMKSKSEQGNTSQRGQRLYWCHSPNITMFLSTILGNKLSMSVLGFLLLKSELFFFFCFLALEMFQFRVFSKAETPQSQWRPITACEAMSSFWLKWQCRAHTVQATGKLM